MKATSRALLTLTFLAAGATVQAGDMLKPWASVVSGPNLPPGYHWTYESFEYESDCKKENSYQLARLQKPAAPIVTASTTEADGENPLQLQLQLDIDAEVSAAPRTPVATAMGCVYQGSKYQTLLKLRNWRNPAVLCIAKEKKLRDYRVVLVGAPRETDDYRCD